MVESKCENDCPAESHPSPEDPPVSYPHVHPLHLATSTFLSLVMVLVLLLFARLLVPSLVESIRYGWYRGQLRAEYEISGKQLKSVSLDSLADVSQLVSRRMGPSVVHINVRRSPSYPMQAGGLQDSVYEGQGSGFLIDESGFILTNQHVLDGGGEIEVTLSDGRRLPAELVGSDRNTDLAVIQITASGLMAVEWGDSDKVVVGTPVWAVGSPFGLQQTVTFGIISGKHRVDFRSTQDAHNIHGGNPYGDLMQSDVALNPGNSGGPLVNSLGQVVGVNAAILGDTFRGVSFSIPSQVARQVAEHLVQEGSVPRGWLGVELGNLSPDEKYSPDGTRRSGVRVLRFPYNRSSPARRAGLHVGDVIVSFEGVDVHDSASLIRMIGEAEVGTVVTLGIERPEARIISGALDDNGQAAIPNAADRKSSADTSDGLGVRENAAAIRRLNIEVKLDRRDPEL